MSTEPVQINTAEIEITLKLPARAVGVLLQGLDQLPHGAVRQLHEHLSHQTNVQVGAFIAKQREAADASNGSNTPTGLTD